MKNIFKNMHNTIKHLETLHDIFTQSANFKGDDKIDYEIYKENENKLKKTLDGLDFYSELYGYDGRQMILADFFEYIFFGRGYYSMYSIEDNGNFIKAIMYFVNLLMCYEAMTVSSNLRKKFLEKLVQRIPSIEAEEEYTELKRFTGSVGLPKKKSDAPDYLNNYFDSMLPKTAGGLWHEMLVYAFVLRFNIGYIFPLLLHQKVISLDEKLSPPDLIILHKKTKRYYGIEIGTLKERQTGGFMVPSGFPVIPLDTLNCRISDRCPTCKKWIGICPKIIEEFSNCNYKIDKHNIEARCLYECDKYTLEEKISGACPYMKYYDGLHHHYRCVVDKKHQEVIKDIIKKHGITTDTLKATFASKEKKLAFKQDDKRSKKINYLKTHQLWYPEFSKLI